MESDLIHADSFRGSPNCGNTKHNASGREISPRPLAMLESMWLFNALNSDKVPAAVGCVDTLYICHIADCVADFVKCNAACDA